MQHELTPVTPALTTLTVDPLATLVPARGTDTRGVRNLREQVQMLESRVARHEFWDQLLTSMCQCPDQRSAARLAASELQRQWGANRVAIGLRRWVRSQVRLIGLSDVADFSTRSELVRKLEAAMDEAVWQKELVLCDENSPAERPSPHAHRQLRAAMGNTQVVTIPLMDRHRDCWGAVLVVGANDPGSLDAMREFAASASQPFVSVLQLWRRTTSWPGTRLARSVWGHRGRRFVALAAAGLLVLAALLWPVPYRMTCDCETQPTARRFVVAPFDSTLDEAFAAPGDRVSQGQVLARLDGRDVRVELATAEADYQRASKERDTALANGQTSAAQMARLEMESLDLQIQRGRQRSQELDIRSPIDGILISGDWQRAHGARLTIGQTLFEIGPLDRMIVEIALPDEEVHLASPGSPVHVCMNAVAQHSWTGSLGQVHPRAEIRDGQNVFMAEMAVDNPDGSLLPGMKGTAHIRGPTRALGWNLFHKPWYAVRKWLGI
ncbi:MAG: efflux RND transporter periplasmic adaptor subunit [Pirellulaceae bacterium]